jgi:hypothetical protein
LILAASIVLEGLNLCLLPLTHLSRPIQLSLKIVGIDTSLFFFGPQASEFSPEGFNFALPLAQSFSLLRMCTLKLPVIILQCYLGGLSKYSFGITLL